MSEPTQESMNGAEPASVPTAVPAPSAPSDATTIDTSAPVGQLIPASAVVNSSVAGPTTVAPPATAVVPGDAPPALESAPVPAPMSITTTSQSAGAPPAAAAAPTITLATNPPPVQETTTLATNPPPPQLTTTPPLQPPVPALTVQTTPPVDSLKRPLSVDVTPNSPRKSKRMRLPTPKGQELELQRATASPVAPVACPCSIILTPSQAITKNKKLPKGYRLVAVSMLANNGDNAAAIVASTQKRKVTRQATAQVNGVHASPAIGVPAPSPMGGRKGRGKNSEAVAHEQKQARIALLKKRLELLKARQAAATTAPLLIPPSITTPLQPKRGKKAGRTPRTPAAFPSHCANPPAPSPPPTTPLASPTTPYGRSDTPNFVGTPLSPGEGKSRSGRVVKAPKFLTADESAPVKLPEPLRHCRNLLTTVMQQKFAFHFCEPVDPVKLNIPDYFKIVHNPMDLGTVKAQLNRGFYTDVEQFAADVRLVWNNAMLYNPKGSFFHATAAEYLALFNKKMAKVPRHATPKPQVKTPRPRSVSTAKKSAPKQGESSVLKEVEGLKDIIGNLQNTIMNMNKKGGGGGGATPSAAARRKQSLDQTPLTTKEKQELKNDIFKLPAQKLQPVVEMCSRNSGSTDQNDEEIEIDIDKLDIPTLRELQRYVKRTLANQNRKKRTGQRKTPTPSRSPAMTPGRGGGGPVASPASRLMPSPAVRSVSPQLEPPRHQMHNSNQYQNPDPYGAPPPPASHQFPPPTHDQYNHYQNPQQAYPPPQPPPPAPVAAPPAAPAPAPSDSSSGSDSDSGSSDSDSDSDSDGDKKTAAKPQQPAPGYGHPAPPQPSFGSFGDPSMFGTAPMPGGRAPASSTPVDLSKGPANAAAWDNLGEADATTGSSQGSAGGDGLWNCFQNKQQEKQDKEAERRQMEARLAADREREREREHEELRRQARAHEEEAERRRREQEEEELERERELQREREAARRAREDVETVDLNDQSMMMDMMDGSFG